MPRQPATKGFDFVSRRWFQQFARRLAPTALGVVLIAGCGASTVTAPPPSSAAAAPATTAATEAPTPSPSPTPSPTPMPTATATPSPTPTPSPSASAVAAGLTGRVVVADQGFAVTLAPGWKSLSLDALDLAAMSKLFPKGSQMQTLLSGQIGQMVAAGVKFWAGDLRPKALTAGFLSNLNVIVVSDPGMGVEALGTVTASQIQSMAGVVGTVANSVVELPAGSAAKISYRLTMTIATGKKLDVAGNQYIFASGGHAYVFTFSYPYAQRSAYGPVVATMAKSIELQP
jgi:hypothetical protein